jgi:hypothetical protein
MKTLLVIPFLLTCFFISGQIKINYVFRDLCTDSITVLDYELFQPSNLKLYKSNGKELIIDSTGLYIFSVSLWRDTENIVCTGNIFFQQGKTYNDTIIIPKFAEEIAALGQQSRIFTYCKLRANGLITDYYENGNVRMKGSFSNGIPISDILFYNFDGKLVKQEIYQSGLYKKTKFYRHFYSRSKDAQQMHL